MATAHFLIRLKYTPTGTQVVGANIYSERHPTWNHGAGTYAELCSAEDDTFSLARQQCFDIAMNMAPPLARLVAKDWPSA